MRSAQARVGDGPPNLERMDRKAFPDLYPQFIVGPAVPTP
jgi:hypothetical protein